MSHKKGGSVSFPRDLEMNDVGPKKGGVLAAGLKWVHLDQFGRATAVEVIHSRCTCAHVYMPKCVYQGGQREEQLWPKHPSCSQVLLSCNPGRQALAGA
jgi:hypothetical protein